MPAEPWPNWRPTDPHCIWGFRWKLVRNPHFLLCLGSLVTEQLRPYTKSWVLLIDTDGHGRKDPASLWTRLADGKTLCVLLASRKKREWRCHKNAKIKITTMTTDPTALAETGRFFVLAGNLPCQWKIPSRHQVQTWMIPNALVFTPLKSRNWIRKIH